MVVRKIPVDNFEWERSAAKRVDTSVKRSNMQDHSRVISNNTYFSNTGNQYTEYTIPLVLLPPA